jgi:hypothetical protein
MLPSAPPEADTVAAIAAAILRLRGSPAIELEPVRQALAHELSVVEVGRIQADLWTRFPAEADAGRLPPGELVNALGRVVKNRRLDRIMDRAALLSLRSNGGAVVSDLAVKNFGTAQLADTVGLPLAVLMLGILSFLIGFLVWRALAAPIPGPLIPAAVAIGVLFTVLDAALIGWVRGSVRRIPYIRAMRHVLAEARSGRSVESLITLNGELVAPSATGAAHSLTLFH